jgi:homoserine O-succinyltransferase
MDNFGSEKWQNMMDQLNDPDKIVWTHAHVIPNFLSQAVEQLYAELV